MSANKQIELKGQHRLYCFTLFICGGPCHLSTAGLFTDGDSLYSSLVNVVNIDILITSYSFEYTSRSIIR